MRKFAISDIHGAKASFLELLDQIQLTKADELYLLGDYIDRGPDSKGVIDHIWQLQSEGYQVHCLRGNHEQMLLDIYYGGERQFMGRYPRMLKSFSAKYEFDIPEKYLSWMRELPYYFEVDTYILVHAGLNFRASDPLIDTDAMLWIRNTRPDIDRTWLNGRTVIHGHTPAAVEAICSYASKLKDTPQLVIDAGCVYGRHKNMGYLCAFELGTQELTFQKCLDR